MVALSACSRRREVMVWMSYWHRSRSGNAIGLTKVVPQRAVRAQHGPYCSHTEEHFSDIWRPHSYLVYSLGRHGHGMVTALCDGGFTDNLAAHHRSAYNPAVWWGVGSVVCYLHPDSNVGWPNVGPTLGVPTLGQRWGNLLLSDWLGCEKVYPYGWCTQPNQHSTEPQGCMQFGGVLLGCA